MTETQTATQEPADTPATTPELTETHASQGGADLPHPDACDECHGRVKPGELCGNCGLNRLNETSATFLQSTELPYYPPKLDCCEHAAIEVLADPDGRGPRDIIVAHSHSPDCDVWRYI